jgi:uncharacterized protein (DUF305 family)
MRKTIGFRDGWPCFWTKSEVQSDYIEKLFAREMTRAQLDTCDELVEKSSNPEVVKLAQKFIDNWRKEI